MFSHMSHFQILWLLLFFCVSILSLITEKFHVICFSGEKVNSLHAVNGLITLLFCLVVSTISVKGLRLERICQAVAKKVKITSSL